MPAPDHLVLFDLDGTLLNTFGAGMQAMGIAGRELFVSDFDETRGTYAGRIDPEIMIDLLRLHDIEPTEQAIERFRDGYRRHLRLLLGNGHAAEVCPGIPQLLDAIEADPAICLGLLTGNNPETGTIKLHAGGIDVDRFEVAVWAVDSRSEPQGRDDLPIVALERFADRFGSPIAPERVTIIGDTPADISCARACGVRVLAVGTGPISVEDLAAHNPDRTLPDLAETHAVIDWLVRHA